MRRHPLDPFALVAGVVAIVAGTVATLHQSGAIALGLPAVVLLALLVLGLAGAALVLLSSRRPAGLSPPSDDATSTRQQRGEHADLIADAGADEAAG
jgi:hypothetical protein